MRRVTGDGWRVLPEPLPTEEPEEAPAIEDRVGVLGMRMGKLSASVQRLVEELPFQDPLGIAERLLGALSDVSAALARRVLRTERERDELRQRAKSGAAEAGYLARLCQQVGYGHPEQVDSTVRRVDALERALSGKS